jgi:hypothetical protein
MAAGDQAYGPGYGSRLPSPPLAMLAVLAVLAMLEDYGTILSVDNSKQRPRYSPVARVFYLKQLFLLIDQLVANPLMLAPAILATTGVGHVLRNEAEMNFKITFHAVDRAIMAVELLATGPALACAYLGNVVVNANIDTIVAIHGQND